MGKLKFYLGVILIVLLGSCGQKTVDKKETAKNDSIQKLLKLAGNDTLDSKLRDKYNDKAFSMIDLDRNDTLTRWYLYNVNLNLYKLGSKDIIKKAKLLIEQSYKVKDTIGISRGNECLGFFYVTNSRNELAIQYFFNAKKGYSSKELFKDEIRTMKNIALTQSYANDFLGSIKTSYEIIKLSKEHNFDKYINTSYINIGNNLSNLKNEKKAIYYFNKVSLDEESYQYFAVNNNIASSYLELGNYKQALIYLNKILKNKNFKTDKWNANAITYSLLGRYYINVNTPKAYKFLKKAEILFELRKSFNGENYNQIFFSDYYSRINDTLNAIKTARKALVLSKSYKNPLDQLTSLAQLIKVDKDNVSNNAQDYIRINDSLQITERKFRDKYAQILYETDEIKKEKESAVKQKWIVSGISGTILIIILLLLTITRQRLKQKELKSFQLQQKANEEIYKLMLEQKGKEEQARNDEKRRIAIELHDGVMNKLSSARLNLDVLNYKKDEQTIEKCLTHIAQIYKIEQEIRSISHDLSHEQFKSANSFVILINDIISTQNEITKTDYQLEMDASIKWDNISSNIKMNLYRIIQEATHNINKFAEAKLAIISFILDGSNICLSITDDGKGFDTEIKSEGIGLRNIKERVGIMKGKFILQSVNKNTSLNIAIPFNYVDQNITK